MTMIGSQMAGLLEALHEPTMLVDRDGTIVHANRSLRRLIGSNAVERTVAAILADETGNFDRYLERCLGAGDSLIGSINLRTDGGTQRLQCKGNAVQFDDQKLVLLRLLDFGTPRFSALTETLAELRKELKVRKRSEAMLEESVRERELLLRELEHRVKNNMQMLSALLSGAEREAGSAEARAALRGASMKFAAVRTVQQLLYRSDALDEIGSEPLVRTLVEAVSALATEPLRTETHVESIGLPIQTAMPLGLILNELLTNAVKYGRPSSGVQQLNVDFSIREDKIYLAVQDNGPGFDSSVSRKRASGIGLVRGLLRQLGGALEVELAGGTRCIVTIPAPRDVQ